MQKKSGTGFAEGRQLPGIGRLLLIQLVLVTACLWLGLILYQLPEAGGGLLAVALTGAVLVGMAVSPACGRWIGSLLLAAGLMALFSQVIPAAWFQGPVFVLASLASAALAVVLRRPA